MLIKVNEKIMTPKQETEKIKQESDHSFSLEILFETLANIFMNCVGLVIVANMYKIAISI